MFLTEDFYSFFNEFYPLKRYLSNTTDIWEISVDFNSRESKL